MTTYKFKNALIHFV